MAEIELITTIDEFTAEYKKGIGAVLPYRPTKEASLDNIRRFGDGVTHGNSRTLSSSCIPQFVL